MVTLAGTDRYKQETISPLYLTPGYPLAPTKHVFVAGQNGSGKTFLVRRLLSTRPYVIVVDTKPGGTALWQGFRLTNDVNEALASPGQWQWRPPEGYDADHFRAAFRAITTAGGWYIDLDEGHDFTIGGADRTAGVNLLLSQGRERGITTYFCSQRAVWVPTFVTSETYHTFCFYMKRRDDRQTMADLMIARGRDDPMYAQMLAGPTKEHGFFYSNSRMQSAVEFGPVSA